MDNPIASDKIKIKKEMFSYQLRIANFYNIHICTVKELIPNFLTKKNVFHYENLLKASSFKARIEAKN